MARVALCAPSTPFTREDADFLADTMARVLEEDAAKP